MLSNILIINPNWQILSPSPNKKSVASSGIFLQSAICSYFFVNKRTQSITAPSNWRPSRAKVSPLFNDGNFTLNNELPHFNSREKKRVFNFSWCQNFAEITFLRLFLNHPKNSWKSWEIKHDLSDFDLSFSDNHFLLDHFVGSVDRGLFWRHLSQICDLFWSI